MPDVAPGWMLRNSRGRADGVFTLVVCAFWLLFALLVWSALAVALRIDPPGADVLGTSLALVTTLGGWYWARRRDDLRHAGTAPTAAHAPPPPRTAPSPLDARPEPDGFE